MEQKNRLSWPFVGLAVFALFAVGGAVLTLISSQRQEPKLGFGRESCLYSSSCDREIYE
jgi:hypothetical protein